MNIKVFFSLGFVLSLIFSLHSQTSRVLGSDVNASESGVNHIIKGGFVRVNNENVNRTYVGSPYIFEGWQLASVFDSSGKKILTQGRFNALTNELEIKYKDKIIALHADSKLISKVDLNGKIFMPSKDDKGGNTFLQVLGNQNEKITILKKYSANLHEKPYRPAISTDGPEIEVKHKAIYFLSNNNEALMHKFKPSKKGFLALVSNSEKRNKLKDFINNENISFKKDEDLMKMLKFYNSLI